MSEPVTFKIALKQHDMDNNNVNDTGIVGSSRRYTYKFLDGTDVEAGTIGCILQACRQKGEGIEVNFDSDEPKIAHTNNETLQAFPTRKWNTIEEAKNTLGLNSLDTSLATEVNYAFLDAEKDCLVCTFRCEQGRKQANEQHDIIVTGWARPMGVYHDVVNQTDWSKL